MGERLFDILCCCEESQAVMEEIAADGKQPMERRRNALFMSFDCDIQRLLDSHELAYDPSLGDVYRALCWPS